MLYVGCENRAIASCMGLSDVMQTFITKVEESGDELCPYELFMGGQKIMYMTAQHWLEKSQDGERQCRCPCK